MISEDGMIVMMGTILLIMIIIINYACMGERESGEEGRWEKDKKREM